LLVLIPAYLYGIHYLPLRGEEANRILTAYEMHYFGDYFNLTHLGEPYYAKPPLFMWVVLLFAKLLGWSQESARLISFLASFGTALLTYLFALKLLRDRTAALLSAFILLTLGDLPLFYGFLAEIDAFHMFVFTLAAVGSFILLQKRREFLAFSYAGFLTALVFLTKGLPALYHIPLTFLIFLLYTDRWKRIFSAHTLGGVLSFLVPLGLWISQIKHPKAYLLQLWYESFNRTPVAQDRLPLLLKHFLTYPLLNLRQLLPHSLYAAFNLKRIGDFFANSKREFLLLLALIGFNYLPYLVSPGARGRYIMVIFPFFATFLGFMLKDFLPREVKFWKPLYGLLTAIFILGLFFAFENQTFFGTYGYLPLIGFASVLFLFAVGVLFKLPKNWLVFTVFLIGVLKFGYINYFAPWKEFHHPEREIALELSKVIPKGAVIRYLPRKVNMELCAYTDMFTRGIVLRKRGDYFLTREGELPEGHFRILKTYKGWVVGIFLQKGH